MNVKDIIRTNRVRLDMNMRELAEKVGVSEATISRWESGEIANMKQSNISALAAALGITPGELMGWDQGAKVDLPKGDPRLGAYGFVSDFTSSKDKSVTELVKQIVEATNQSSDLTTILNNFMKEYNSSTPESKKNRLQMLTMINETAKTIEKINK